MGAYAFEELEKKDIKTHYRGLINKAGKTMTVQELQEPVDTMEIHLVNVHRPTAFIKQGKLEYDYSMYTPSLKNCLIPLEIMYRNGLPESSSVFRRLEQGQTTVEELGLSHYPKRGEKLSKPIFDVSTKLEEKDRYITWKEAQQIAGLTREEMVDIKSLLLTIDNSISQIALKAALENEDGKIELAIDPRRELMVVDVVGTLDECRFTYDGLHVSKEIARQFYRKTDWFKDVEEAKRKADAEGVKDWKTLCRSQPPKMGHALKTIISEMYMGTSNEVIGQRMFDVSRLAETVEKYRDYVGIA